MDMTRIFTILLSTIFIENYIFSKFLGICPFLGVSKKLNSAFGMSLAVIFVMTLASAVTWPINAFLLGEDLAYMQTLVFILVIAMLVQLVETALKCYVPALYKSLGIYLPLITTNCAVLAVTLLNVQSDYNFLESVVNGFSAGVGFMLAMVLFSGVRERIEGNNIPVAFQGMPIALVAAGLVSMAFGGFSGMVQGIFG